VVEFAGDQYVLGLKSGSFFCMTYRRLPRPWRGRTYVVDCYATYIFLDIDNGYL